LNLDISLGSHVLSSQGIVVIIIDAARLNVSSIDATAIKQAGQLVQKALLGAVNRAADETSTPSRQSSILLLPQIQYGNIGARGNSSR